MEEFREMFMILINVGSVVGMHCLSSQVGSASREQHICNFAYNLSDIFITLSNFSTVLERVNSDLMGESESRLELGLGLMLSGLGLEGLRLGLKP